MSAEAAIPDLPVFVSGRGEEHGHILLFIHGWPDDETVFSAQISHFEADYRVVSVRLPWFSSYNKAEADSAARSYSRWGYDLDILAVSFARTASNLLEENSSTKITVIAHDWGAVIAQIADLENPGLFHSMVAIDVAIPFWCIKGPTWNKTETITMLYFGWVYHWRLAATFLLANVVPTIATRYVQYFTRSLVRQALWNRPLYNARVALPTEQKVLNNSPAKVGIHPLSGYLYYYLTVSYWRGLFGLPLSRGRKTIVPGGERLKTATDFPTCPILFMYGAAGYPFHQKAWEEAVKNRTDGSKVIAFPDANHWVQIEKADETNTAIEQWLRSCTGN